MVLTLRRLSQRSHIDGGRWKPFPCHFDEVLCAAEYRRSLVKCVAGLQMQLKARAAFCAGVLRQQENACLFLFRYRPIAKPCCERNAQNMLRRDSAEVEHDGSEAAVLQQQIRYTQSLIKTGPRFGGKWFGEE